MEGAFVCVKFWLFVLNVWLFLQTIVNPGEILVFRCWKGKGVVGNVATLEMTDIDGCPKP